MNPSYEELMRSYREAETPEIRRFRAALEAEIKAECAATFGLGDRIAVRRKKLHLTQAEVAERVGIKQSELARIEQGARPVDEILRKIATVLQTDLNQ